jgi:uncharacterized protein
MAYFVLIGLDKPGAAELRAATRPDHLAYLATLGDKAKLVGPFLNDEGGAVGSMVIVEVDSQAEAQAIQAADPYAKVGLFASTDLRPWKLVGGGFA